MSRIVRDSVLNATAMTITSVLSLLLIPVLLRTYGLDSYGLIPLIRLLTPLGAVGLLALGLPALAIRAATAPNTSKEDRCVTQSSLLAISIVLGALISLSLLVIGWPELTRLFNVETSQQVAFARGFHILLISLPVLFAGALLNSVFTGLGRFRILRVTEVTTSTLYFLVAVVAAWTKAPIEVVLIAMLAADFLRAVILGIQAYHLQLIRPRMMLRPAWRSLIARKEELRVLTVFNLSGYARRYAPHTTVVLLFGPAAVGLYDAIERIPRAFKTLLGLVNTAVLPRALALDTETSKKQLHSLMIRGMRLTMLFMLPANVCVMIYAAPLLAVWLGDNLRYAAPMLVLLMIPTTLEMMLSIFSTASLSRLPLMRRQNLVNLVEITCIVALTLALGSTLGQTAAYWSAAFAATTGYLLRIGLFLSDYGIAKEEWHQLVGKTLAGSVAGNIVVYLIAKMLLPGDLARLATAPVAVAAAGAAIILIWTHTERRDLRIVFESLRNLVIR